VPELPEVETIVRDLRATLIGKLIVGMILRQKCITNMLRVPPDFFYECTIGQNIISVLRKGKYIIVPLSNGNVVVFHLGMTGKLLIKPPVDVSFEERLSNSELIDKHTHLLLELVDDSGEGDDVELHFNDVRTFGNIWLVPNVEDINELDVPGLKDLGPDALGITLEDFSKVLKSKRNVKSVLLDQRKIAGIGNIYADEALFSARIHPLKTGGGLGLEETARLWFAVKYVLKQGIKYRGSSISDYTDASGSTGSFQNHHKVYGKVGQKCADCGDVIVRIRVGGRSTHFCPTCQPTDRSSKMEE